MKDSLYKPKPKLEISYFVNARQKTYKYSTEIYIPANAYEKLEEGYEATVHATQSSPLNPTSEEEKLERSKRRAYSAMKDLALSNAFELFVTFTFKSARADPDLCKQKMNGWLKRQRKLDKNFQYLIVAEFHKDKESLHFHGLIAGYGGPIARSKHATTGKPLSKKGRQVYDFPNYTLGWSEVYYIGNTDEDRIKSAFYLLKYIKKDLPTFKSKKRYWSSKGLQRPLIIENPDDWYLKYEPTHSIETSYGKILFFDNKEIKEHLGNE